MPNFTVQLTKPATADLERASDQLRATILEGIAVLEEDPFPSGQNKKKLKGFKFPMYRLRVGNYRVLYRIDQRLITIMRIINRKDLERMIRHLKRR